MSKKLTNYLKELLGKLKSVAVLGRILLITGIVLVIMLSFYWNFGLQPFEIKSIFTLDTGLVTFSLAPEFFLALAGIFVFYAGYRVYARKKWGGEAKVSSIESVRELVGKFIMVICLGIVGIWYTYSQFSTKSIWSFHIPDVVRAATGSIALEINAVIGLLLLVILVIEIRIRYEKGSPDNSK